ncbi:hypothetical protein [Haloarchaeobius sp. DFWS5]|uniref:hypothetical protein n=1 Tax=Haloarchaeobius sp. DFWS5 TaxID=3446114 RepID=UPI003EBCEB39
MVQTHSAGITGKEVRVNSHRWTLTGDIGVRNRGTTLAVHARRADNRKRQPGVLYFDAVGTESVNPGALKEQFVELKRRGDEHFLVVEDEGGRYRYELHRVQYV